MVGRVAFDRVEAGNFGKGKGGMALYMVFVVIVMNEDYVLLGGGRRITPGTIKGMQYNAQRLFNG